MSCDIVVVIGFVGVLLKLVELLILELLHGHFGIQNFWLLFAVI